MSDVHSKAKRSYNMSRIRAKNTKPEMLVRRFLFSKGYRYGLHNRKLPGSPDLVLRKYNTVIFVNGCFWHGHTNCKNFKVPKTRTEWWLDKFNRNKNNDKINVRALSRLGWNVITIWECELRKLRKEKTLLKLIKTIQS